MKVDQERCVGCGNCLPVCPMGARYIEDGTAHINEDECVECGACLRFTTPERVNPSLVRAAHSIMEGLRLRYDQPFDVCPGDAMYEDELEWPRIIRRSFSDPLMTHAGTGISGRGTDEIKTNDVTGRLQPGWAGILVEFGRPGIGARFHDVEHISTAVAQVEGIRFEPANPVTELMTDRKTGRLDPSVADEKVMSCILEILVPLERLAAVLARIEEELPKLDTVVSLAVNGRCGRNGELPYGEAVAASSFALSPNGKTNLGLAKCEQGGG